MRDRFGVPPSLFGGLIVYTLANTRIPGLVLRLPPPEFEAPHAAELPVAVSSEEGGEPAEVA